MKKDCLIEYKNVSLSYGQTEAVKHASFVVHEGDILNIIGPNGSGKTTLVKSLVGELKPSKGEILKSCKRLGYVPQKLMIKRNFPLTVQEFIYTGFLKQDLLIKPKDAEIIKTWIIRMKLDPKILTEPIHTLSGGQLQRAYIIRTLISKPDVLILDEPTSALDPSFREQFYELLKTIKEELQMTIIHITHDLTDLVLENSLVMYIDQEIKFYGTYIDYHQFEHEGHHHG